MAIVILRLQLMFVISHSVDTINLHRLPMIRHFSDGEWSRRKAPDYKSIVAVYQ